MKLLACLDMAPALDAAKRVKAQLPSRKHVLEDDKPSSKRNHKRAVIIQGSRYPSLRRAALACNVAGSVMLAWIASGRAKYAED